ncbi:hypothetical protein HID58_004535 [Brassica napus]|uniref:Uncharacterized protein n=1 Tax=Brassica napus TaxID=3708 RepID=A0ABQ8E632_BRANA|nr:hypothetical protein HID58_004535 [Brassica napus]
MLQCGGGPSFEILEAKNINKRGQLMSLEMLLIDGQNGSMFSLSSYKIPQPKAGTVLQPCLLGYPPQLRRLSILAAISQYNSATSNASTVSRPFTLPEKTVLTIINNGSITRSAMEWKISSLGRPLPYLWESLLAKKKPTDSAKNGGLETSERNLFSGPLPGHKKRLTIAFMNRVSGKLRQVHRPHIYLSDMFKSN